MSISCECNVLCRYRFLRQADHSSKEVLPSVVCITECDHESSIMRGLGTVGLLRYGKKKRLYFTPGISSWTA